MTLRENAILYFSSPLYMHLFAIDVFSFQTVVHVLIAIPRSLAYVQNLAF